MKRFHIVSILLLLLVIIDATGDAFRLLGWQIPHHSMEMAHIAGWFAIWALFRFQREYIVMYILGRIALFDMIFNVVAGNPITYIGNSSLYDISLRWFSGLVGEPGHLVWIIRVMALVAWGALLFRFRNQYYTNNK